jgi:hypothetical protein
MAEKQTEVEKLNEEVQQKKRSYKAPSDPERAFHLVSAARLLKDYPNISHLAASFVRELEGMELKQADLDLKDDAEFEKRLAEAKAKDAKAVVKENDTAPLSKGRAA